MKLRPFGPAGFFWSFIVMSGLVVGGLAWVTVASLRVEAAQREARAQADRSRDERLALWRLDGRVLPALGLENNRPFAHYTALHALYPVIETDEIRVAANSSRFPSPLLSAPLQEWMVLHFQIDPETGWESPQVIPAELADRLQSPFLNLALNNVTPQREQLLAELRVKLPAAQVIRTLARSEQADPEESRFIVPVPFANETAMPKPAGLRPDDPPPGMYRDAGALVQLAEALTYACELRAASQQTGAGRGGASVTPWSPALPPQAAVPDLGNAAGSGDAAGANSPPQALVQPGQLDRVGTKGQQQGGKLLDGNQDKQAGDYLTRQSTTNKGLARGAYDLPGWSGNMRSIPPNAPNTGPPVPGPVLPPLAAGGGFGALGGSTSPQGNTDPDVLKKQSEVSARSEADAVVADVLRSAIDEVRLQQTRGRFRGEGNVAGSPTVPARQAEEKDAGKGPARYADATNNIALARDGAGLAEPPPPPAASPKAPPTVLPVAVHVGPLRPYWLTADDGSEVLVLVRAATLEHKVVYQGVLLDWPAVRAVLGEMVADLFPAAELTPMRSIKEAAPEQTMTALPIRLNPGPMPELPPAGWTPLRIGLALAWIAALTALVAVGIGGRALVDLSERRIRFVSAVTHELRTPLTSLRLYLDLLNSGLVEDEERRKEYLATLSGESDRLNRLIENVLDFAMLEKRSVRAALQPANVRELLDEVRQTWSDRCAADGRELVVIVTVPEDQSVITDRRIAAQVLGVLVDNARKYAKDAIDGRIWIWAKPGAKGRLILEVEDRGPGVPARERGTIFKPFRRGRTADTTAGGAGLGLALAVHWADQLNGTLAYRPADGGVGACFRLELPAEAR